MSTAIRDRFMNRFGMYSKMQDQLMLLGNSDNLVSLSITLNLYSINPKTKNTSYYYQEVQYVSERLNQETRKIRRNYDVYLQLENVKPIGNYREFIIMRGKDIEFCRWNLIPKFKELIENFDEIYQKTDSGKLQVTDYMKPFMIDIGQKCLVFRPGINKSFTEELVPTVDIFLNAKENNKVSMTFEQMYGLIYILRTIDIYTYASNMLAFLQRPPATTNLIDMTTNQEYNEIANIPKEDPTKRRFIGGQKKPSYFDN